MISYIHKFLLLVLLLVPSVSLAEYINSFASEVVISPDGSFVVSETIDYFFTEARHGIFRDIPTKHPQEASSLYKERYVEIEVLSVEMDGNPVQFEEIEERNNLRIKIGDLGRTVRDAHTFDISYKVIGGLTFLTNGEVDFYWNTVGTGWEIPIRNSVSTVTGPPGLFIGQQSCYQGGEGTTLSCEVSVEDNSITFRSRALAPEEGVTIAIGLTPSLVEKVVFERNQLIILWVAGLVLWFLGLIYFVMQYRTEYRTGSAIIPQYEPYQNLKPMYAGLLYDGTLHPQDITACIVYLAEQGYLKITKIQKKVLFFFEVDDYEITLVKPVATIESAFQRDVLSLLFGDSLDANTSVTLSSLRDDLGKQTENRKILKKLKADLEKDLEREGFFQVNLSKFIFPGAIMFIGIVIYIAFISYAEVGGSIAFVVVAVGVSLGILGFMYRRRTRKGYEALDHLEGFKQFLSVTEKERYAFHNAPQKSPQQFMEYLPYAIALGVEEEWGEVFKDVTIPSPEWYGGGTVGSFSAANLTTSLGAFSTAFASSSGSSASSGGGSAGGGGGGGGGGSW